MITRNSRLLFLLILGIMLGYACGDDVAEDQIPQALVNETLNLTNIQYQNLEFVGGHVNITGGVRGIIVYRASSSEYRAFERNCSFQPLDACATVEVESSGLFMIDTCCTSTFNFDGFPTGGPATLPLRRYATTLDGNFLHITN